MLSVLLVDDDPRKQSVVKAALLSLGLLEGDVVIAGDAAAARRALNSRHFDVMLLDVLIPVRSGAVPNGESSIDLLRQMLEDENIPQPVHIVAITADEEALRIHGEEFRLLTTQVLRVDPASDVWKSSLRLLVDHCRASSRRNEYDFDVVIQTALRDPEYNAVVKYWPVDWSADVRLAKGLFFRQGILRYRDQELKVACCHATTMGLVAAADLAGKLIARLRPRILAMSGVCGGVGEDLSIGDLVVAEKAWDWQSGKYVSGGGFESAVDQKDASPELLAQARRVESELGSIDAGWGGVRPETPSRIHVAPMVSGSSVVADQAVHDLLRSQHRKTAAVDMEAFGVYFAAQMADIPVPKVLCIKGVSDLADVDKADWARDYCSYMSAMVLRRVVENELQR